MTDNLKEYLQDFKEEIYNLEDLETEVDNLTDWELYRIDDKIDEIHDKLVDLTRSLMSVYNLICSELNKL